ncbi:MAG: tRNA pseudouridine(38-40) synthase TruA [Firmicutes bacterium]|nr:tRNA pseudouridine(38-40) synthase TruA [Bacillota bacterium]
MKKNILLTIEYDGTGFKGWQRQPDVRTVQGELERVLSFACKEEITINGTSRTDAGVHALGQRATFSMTSGLPVEKLPKVVNNLLCGGAHSLYPYGDIRVVAAEDVDEDFHARFNCKGKMYRYIIRNTAEPDIFRRNYCYQIAEKLDVKAMAEAGQHIVGTHDFKCFQASGGEEKETTVRTIHSLTVQRDGENVIIEVAGDGFLYNMVRIITGTLAEVGLGKKAPSEVAEIIKSKDRRNAGHTAPAEGLYLVEVYY